MDKIAAGISADGLTLILSTLLVATLDIASQAKSKANELFLPKENPSSPNMLSILDNLSNANKLALSEFALCPNPLVCLLTSAQISP